MRQTVQLITVVFSLTAAARAQSPREIDLSRHFEGLQGCFVLLDVQRDEIARYNPQRCAERFSPCSTFKVANSLIGLETGVISGPEHVHKWDGTKGWRDELNRDHDLRSAIKHSVVWYYQRIAAEVGEQRMRDALAKLDYGDQDMSAGLTTFWLGSSLEISADEQVRFLRRLQAGTLPFSERSQRIVREIMQLEQRGNATLYGKTGTAGDPIANHATLGWFVGWVEEGDRVRVFACNIAGGTDASGRRARRIAMAILEQLEVWSAK